jgi:hypothetical protein
VEELLFERPRTANPFGTYPLAAGGAVVMQLSNTVYELAVVAVAVPIAVLAARTRSTTVTAEGIAIRAVRRRFVPWSQVRAITVEDGAAARSIDLILVDDSRLRLPAPVERRRRSPDADSGESGAKSSTGHAARHAADFDADYAAIMQAWLRTSGPGDDDHVPGRKRAVDATLSRRPE